MITGGTDGIIRVYDIILKEEDMAMACSDILESSIFDISLSTKKDVFAASWSG